MTAPRRDETTMLSDAEIADQWDANANVPGQDKYNGDWALFRDHNHPFHLALLRFARAIEAAVVSALSARGGEPSGTEVEEAANAVALERGWSVRFGDAHQMDLAMVRAGIALGRRHAVSPEAALSASFDKGAEAGRAECERTHEAMIREAVRNALTEAMYDLPGDYSAPAYIALREFRDREYPLPVPPAPKGVRVKGRGASTVTVRFVPGDRPECGWLVGDNPPDPFPTLASALASYDLQPTDTELRALLALAEAPDA